MLEGPSDPHYCEECYMRVERVEENGNFPRLIEVSPGIGYVIKS